ncbi:hypothetical protein NKH91_05980 [Mesorhizobium sp. M0894]|uniref:hypothetical protein n=1 Tax=unclassified Mesorhizobium TaxID=325217 RepID=UPI00333D4190
MAKDTKKKLPQFTTPRGTFVYPKLSEPDYGTKDYPKPDGEYSLKLRMSQSDADLFIRREDKEGNSIKSLYDAALQEAERLFAELKVETRKKLKEVKPNELFTVLYDKETEEPTGEVEFKFKMKASGEFKKGPKAGSRWNRKPDLFDAKGRKIGKGVNIWGGSEGKVSFAVRDYFVPGTAAAGLTLMLGAVQVIELVSEGSRAADSYGFGEEEGFGYDPDDYREDDAGEDKSNEGSSDSQAGEDDF